MVPDSESVLPSELLYRRVSTTHPFMHLFQEAYVSHRYFLPVVNKKKGIAKDQDGISLSRENQAGPISAGRGMPAGAQFWVVQVLAGVVFELGLQVQADPTPDNEDHAVIPELNGPAYLQNQDQLDGWAAEIANHAQKCQLAPYTLN